MNEIYIIIISLLFLQYFDIKYIIILFAGLYILLNYNPIKNKLKNYIPKSTPLEYTSKIEKILKNLKKYKKTSRNQYLKGIFYWNEFIKNIQELEDDTLQNYNQYFDKAFDALKASVNSFQSISSQIPERRLIDGIKFNDFTNAKNTKQISQISKELYSEGYKILYNLSLRLNERWKSNPNIYNKQIILDHPLPYDSDMNDYDLYI